MNVTPIEWTDFSANPLKFRNAAGEVVWGCVHASPGCQHCYAETLAKRYGRGGPFNVPTMAGLTPFLDEKELRQMLTAKRIGGKDVSGSRCFVGDMTDIFGDWVSDALLDRLFAVFALRKDLTFQILTKRADRMRDYCSRLPNRGCNYFLSIAGYGSTSVLWGHMDLQPWPLPNVWLGVSCEDQQRAYERIPQLLQTPATVRFISAEPLLGDIDLGLNNSSCTCCEPSRYFSSRWVKVTRPLMADFPLNVLPENAGLVVAPGQVVRGQMNRHGALSVPTSTGRALGVRPGEVETLPALDWAIVGGESGPGARPCDLAWIRSIAEQCRVARVPVFCKQLGSKVLECFPRKPEDPRVIEGWRAIRRNTEDGREEWYRYLTLRSRKGGDPSEWPADLRVRAFPQP